jgi:uncharacterized protein (TIGR02265 family)
LHSSYPKLHQLKNAEPQIKGIFVKSHIKALLREKGAEGLRLLELKYGKKFEIKNNDSIPLSEEIALVENVLEILRPGIYTAEEKSFEAGRLHFRNFSTTPLAKIIFPLYRKKFKLLMTHVANLAGHVFKGVSFSSEDIGEKAVKVIMNNYYHSRAHVEGLFYEWLLFSGLDGAAQALEDNVPGRCVCIIRWK